MKFTDTAATEQADHQADRQEAATDVADQAVGDHRTFHSEEDHRLVEFPSATAVRAAREAPADREDRAVREDQGDQGDQVAV